MARSRRRRSGDLLWTVSVVLLGFYVFQTGKSPPFFFCFLPRHVASRLLLIDVTCLHPPPPSLAPRLLPAEYTAAKIVTGRGCPVSGFLLEALFGRVSSRGTRDHAAPTSAHTRPRASKWATLPARVGDVTEVLSSVPHAAGVGFFLHAASGTVFLPVSKRAYPHCCWRKSGDDDVPALLSASLGTKISVEASQLTGCQNTAAAAALHS
ncbi:hypothetical protein MTO96_047915 [Rhipicephalus appendiculatus]